MNYMRQNKRESGSNRMNMSATMKERSSMQFAPPNVDENAASYLKNLDDNIKHMENMMVELNGGLMKFKSGIPVLRESLQTKQVLGQDFTKEIIEQNAKKIAEAVERGERLEEEKQSLLMELSKLQQSKEKKESEISTLSEKLKKTEQELKNTQTRLSEVMGNKLLDNNPDIADLSDKHRPSKLAEKYSELYDNEWTDAFEAMQTEFNYDEKKCVKNLISILMYINKLCADKWQDYIRVFKDNIKRGQNFRLPDYINKQLKDITKSFAPRMVGDVLKEIMQEFSKLNETAKSMFQLKDVQTYTEVCVDICWLMAAQDPPVFLKAEYGPGDKMDTNVLKAYTQLGETIDFLVWPALFLHEDGPLLSKGVAQAVGSRRPFSTNNTKDTEGLRRSTTYRPPKNAWLYTEETPPITVQAQTHTNMETGDTTQRSVLHQENRNIQQPNVNTGLQGQSGVSSSNSYQLQPFENKITDNTNVTTSNIQDPYYQIGQNPSDERQQQFPVQTGAEQQHKQQQQRQFNIIEWNHHRLPTKSEMERFESYFFHQRLSEEDTRELLGSAVYELCKDFLLYRNMQLTTGAPVPELPNY